jgi:hypothetical protein
MTSQHKDAVLSHFIIVDCIQGIEIMLFSSKKTRDQYWHNLGMVDCDYLSKADLHAGRFIVDDASYRERIKGKKVLMKYVVRDLIYNASG